MTDETVTYWLTHEGQLELALKEALNFLSGHLCGDCRLPITEQPVLGHCRNSQHGYVASHVEEWKQLLTNVT